MGSVRAAVDIFSILSASRLQIHAGEDADVNIVGNIGGAGIILHHSSRRKGIDEESASIQAQPVVHAPQLLFDGNQRWFIGTLR